MQSEKPVSESSPSPGNALQDFSDLPQEVLSQLSGKITSQRGPVDDAIRFLVARGVKQILIAQAFGITKQAVGQIVHGRKRELNAE